MKLLGMLLPWLARRGLEIGGVLMMVAAIDPFILQTILATLGTLLTGNWENVSLGALVGLVSTVGGLIWNARSTFQEQVVVGEKKVKVKDMTEGERMIIETTATNSLRHKKPTLLERLFTRR